MCELLIIEGGWKERGGGVAGEQRGET